VSTRDDILGRLRGQLGRSDRELDEARARVRSVIDARRSGPRPPPGDDGDRFIESARAMLSTVDTCPEMVDVPAAAAGWLRAHGLTTQLVIAPSLAALDWNAAGCEVRIGPAGAEDAVGVTGCFRAIAETGSLMLRSGPDMPPVNSLLPETHIAVVPRTCIVPDMETAWAHARAEWRNWPRAVNLVSGPSRTADIEQTIVLGAHGPFRVHLIVVG
jgi:L-lactate dehydrogenase complex protein LldG